MILVSLLINLFQPIHSTKINISILAMITIGFVWLIWRLKNKKKILVYIFGFFLLPLLPFINQSSINQVKMKEFYLEYLREYQGTDYVWGGEGKWGIDCSGLPRSSFMKANFKYAYLYFNGKALRKFLWLWWYDASAKELLNGYRGATMVDSKIFKINDLRQNIEPGDMATNGSHVLVYLSVNEIIQSDPHRNSVVIDILPAKSLWYRIDVNLVRWKFDD